MNITMNDQTLKTPESIAAFLSGSHTVDLKLAKQNIYACIETTLKRTDYFALRKGEKSVIFEYLSKLTGYSRQHLIRLIGCYRKQRWIGAKSYVRNTFQKTYTNADILLLVEMDECHNTLSGGATKKLCERAYCVFKDDAYERLAKISISHLYNLRKGVFYQRQRRHFSKTQGTKVAIGKRCKPQPNNKPGYLRIDTVHQGDQDGVKGVYHINAVDEVTQMEVVYSVEKISENCLIPVLEAILKNFPFAILNFHSDNGSEYINHCVAKLLNKLHIEFTKSRPRHSNDNGLVESKNGSIVRKVLGHFHIPQKWAPELNEFHENYFIPYMNYHRPCYFAEVVTDEKGKQKKRYPYKDMKTPFERFKSLPNAEGYLKPNISLKELEMAAMAMTDLEAAKRMNKARSQLFKKIFAG
jgi:transposase InsO family protein